MLQALSQLGGWHVVRGSVRASQQCGDQRRLQLPEFPVWERVCSGPGSAVLMRSCWSALTFFSMHTLPELRRLTVNILPTPHTHTHTELLPAPPTQHELESACLPNSSWFLQIQRGGETNRLLSRFDLEITAMFFFHIERAAVVVSGAVQTPPSKNREDPVSRSLHRDSTNLYIYYLHDGKCWEILLSASGSTSATHYTQLLTSAEYTCQMFSIRWMQNIMRK